MSLGGSSNKSSSNTTFTPNSATTSLFTPEWNQISSETSQPFQNYTGEFYPGLTSGQTQATQMANSGIGTGSGAVNSGVSAAQGVTGFTPQTVSPQSILDANIGSYMSPYVESSLAPQLQLLDQQRGQDIAQNQGQFTQSGAFGGSREGVSDALTNQYFGNLESQMIGQGYNSAYQNAQGLAGQDISNQLQAQEANQSAGLAGANLDLGAASTLGNLGGEQQQLGLNDVNAINSLGTQAQNTAANQDAMQYQQYLTQLQYPFMQAQAQEGLLGDLPALYQGASQNGNATNSSIGWGFSLQH